jgi:hypothetical protein
MTTTQTAEPKLIDNPVNGAAVAVVNFVGETAYGIIENAKGSVAPILLSGIGSWMLGTNLVPGLMLGAVDQLGYFTFFRPFNRWLQRNTSSSWRKTEPGKITQRARDVVVSAGSIIAWVLPTLIMCWMLPNVSGRILPHLPARLAFDQTKFVWYWALLANIAPVGAHIVLEILHQEALTKIGK